MKRGTAKDDALSGGAARRNHSSQRAVDVVLAEHRSDTRNQPPDDRASLPQTKSATSQDRRVDSTIDTPPTTPQCPRLVLLSAPRHGSTWFLNSVEQCRFSETSTVNGSQVTSYGSFNSLTELWNPAQKSSQLRNISAYDAAQYVRQNVSIKLFPISVMNIPRLEMFLNEANKRGVRFVALKRIPREAFKSWVQAALSAKWNTHSKGRTKRTIITDEDMKEYMKKSDLTEGAYVRWIESNFAIYEKVLNGLGMHFDVLWYEEIQDRKYIEVGGADGCHVRNCNYVE